MFRIKETNFSIREFRIGDFHRLKEIAANINQAALQKNGYFPFYAFQVPFSDSNYKRSLSLKVDTFLRKAYQERVQTPRSTYRLAVCDHSDQVIGNVTIDMLPVQEPDGRIIYGDLGYFIDPQKGQKGLMTKAVQHVLQIYFQTHSQLDITAHPGNLYSRRLIERFNGKQIGFLEKTSYQGEPRAVFVIFKKDFEQALATRRPLLYQTPKSLGMSHTWQHTRESE